MIDTWTTMTPAEIAELRGRLDGAFLQLELRQQDVARLEEQRCTLNVQPPQLHE